MTIDANAISLIQMRRQLASLTDSTKYDQADAGVVATIALIRNELVTTADQVDVTDYGATGDGVTDDTTAIQAAATAAAGKTLFFPNGTFRLTAAIALSSNTLVDSAGGATLQTAVATISLLSATNKTNIRVRNLKLKYTAIGATSGIGGIAFNTCTYCEVANCEFEAMQWAGVYLLASTYCVVRGCWMHGGTGTAGDSADVCLRGNSSYNLIEANRLLGGVGCYHGVLIQDSDGAGTLVHNIVRGNRIEVHLAYGVCCYQTTARDQFTVIEGNDIKDIDGGANAGTSGTGIYVQTAGGCIVANNHVTNCCVSTSSATNAPAGISIAFDLGGAGAALRPAVVSGNNVDTTKYSGITISGSPGASVTGNYARSTDTANGRGIFVDRASNVSVIGNRVIVPDASARSGIQVSSSDRVLTGIAVSNNIVTGGNDACIQVNASGGNTITAVISANQVVGAGASAIGLLISSGLDCAVTGNYLTAPSRALSLSACTGTRGSSNVLRSAGRTLLTAGVCSGNFFDQSNDYGASTTLTEETTTGTSHERRGNAAPGTGTFNVGDRVQQSVPVVGSPKGWQCTVAGTPGTWVSEGNL